MGSDVADGTSSTDCCSSDISPEDSPAPLNFPAKVLIPAIPARTSGSICDAAKAPNALAPVFTDLPIAPAADETP